MSRGYIETSAVISGDGLYRYQLLRRIASGRRTVLFVGLNPSTADGIHDDNTIRRCVDFAESWNFEVLLMGNLYAYRCTCPRELREVPDPIGPGNRATLTTLIGDAE